MDWVFIVTLITALILYDLIKAVAGFILMGAGYVFPHLGESPRLEPSLGSGVR